MDFISYELFDGSPIRRLTIVDHFTREIMSIEVGPATALGRRRRGPGTSSDGA